MVKLKNGYVATNLQEALRIMKEEKVTPYGGGTDLMVEQKGKPTYLFLHKVAELKEIKQDKQYIKIGSEVTFTDIEQSNIAPQILKDAIAKLAAPAIRNFGTVGGNIGNGSAKADSALIFFVTDSFIHLKSIGSDRIIPIKQFYKKRKELDLKEGELIVEILIPKKHLEHYYYKKIGARNSLAISRVSFAGLFDTQDGVITHLATAFGAVESMIVRHPEIDDILIGKTIEEAKNLKNIYLETYEKAIHPNAGRVSKEYRKTVCMNLLEDFLRQNGIS